MTLTRRHLLQAAPAVLIAAPALAAPDSRLIDGPWTSFGSDRTPDASDWADFLDQYLVARTDGISRIRYAAARKDGVRLTALLDNWQQVDPTRLSRRAAMAFWINLYNAVTIDLVLEAWPVETIKDVRGGILSRGPWREKVVRVAGHDLSLHDIEHGILRPVWRDPRIHYGVNCASIGCPNLAAKPYSGVNINGALNQRARGFIGHPRGVRRRNKGFVVSSIYDWFQEDFGGSAQGVLDHLHTYGAGRAKTGILDYQYDWSINAV